MSLTVTLHIYSDVPNPSWTLTDDQASVLEQLINAIPNYTLEKPAGVIGLLGYSGFSISTTTPKGGLEVKYFIFDKVIDVGPSTPSRLADDRSIEQWLLQLSPPDLVSPVADYVNAQLKSADPLSPFESSPLLTAQDCPICAAKDAPAFEPHIWNVKGVQDRFLCYNYANDNRTNEFAQPGLGGGSNERGRDCDAMIARAVADGLVPVDDFSKPLGKNKGWYVALVMTSSYNRFHWYRQDENGCWSHKVSTGLARNWDRARKPIKDPALCDRRPYDRFCGYMITTRRSTLE